MKNRILKLFIIVLVVLFSSCDPDYIEYPTSSINRELMLSKKELKIANNSKGTVDIVGGIGSYSVISKNTTKAKVKLIGKKIHIDALEIGETEIVVTDNETNIEKTINVTIDEIDFDEVILVEKGPFKFGTKQINFEKNFKIGRYEVTVKQFCKFISTTDKYSLNKKGNKLNPYKFKNVKSKIENDRIIYWPIAGKGNLPIVRINWETAKKYCESKGGRLPSETEWEYAAQGGKDGPGNGNVEMTNDFISTIAWWRRNISVWNELHDVQSKVPNNLEIHNMIGNVAEWCQDSFKYYADYSHIRIDGSAYQDSSEYHVARGGSTGYYYPVENTIHKSRKRNNYYSYSIGFRIAYTVGN